MEEKIKRLSVSEATISAVNAILYSGQGGKDFSAIIDDLTAGSGRNRQLIKMGIGLIERKIQVIVPTIAKKFVEEGKAPIKLTFVGYSVILDVVSYSYEENGKQFEGRMPAAEWESLETWQEPEVKDAPQSDFEQEPVLPTVSKPYNSSDIED